MLKKLSYNLVANIVSIAVGIVAVLVFPKIIGTEPFGYYQLYLFYVGFTIISGLGIPEGIYLKIGGTDYKKMNHNELGHQFFASFIIQLFIYFPFAFVAIATSTSSEDRAFIIFILSGVGVVGFVLWFLRYILQAANRITEYAKLIIAERIFSVGSGLLVLLLGYRGFRLLIVLDLIGRVIAVLMALYYCKEIVFSRPYYGRNDWEDTKEYIKSGSMLLFSGFAATIIIGIARFAIDLNWDIVVFGKISLTISISNMVVRCVNAIGVVLFPVLRNVEERELTNIYFLVERSLSFICVLLFALYQPVGWILSRWLPDYSESIYYAAVLLPMCMYESKNSAAVSTYLKVLRKERQMLWLNIMAVIMDIVLTFISVSMNSVLGVVLSILACMIFRYELGNVIVCKNLGYNNYKKSALDIVLVLCFIVFNTLLGALGMIAYILVLVFYYWICREDIAKLRTEMRRGSN